MSQQHFMSRRYTEPFAGLSPVVITPAGGGSRRQGWACEIGGNTNEGGGGGSRRQGWVCEIGGNTNEGGAIGRSVKTTVHIHLGNAV